MFKRFHSQVRAHYAEAVMIIRSVRVLMHNRTCGGSNLALRSQLASRRPALHIHTPDDVRHLKTHRSNGSSTDAYTMWRLEPAATILSYRFACAVRTMVSKIGEQPDAGSDMHARVRCLGEDSTTHRFRTWCSSCIACRTRGTCTEVAPPRVRHSTHAMGLPPQDVSSDIGTLRNRASK